MEAAAVLLIFLAFTVLQVQPGAEAVTPYLLDPQCAREVHPQIVNGEDANILSNPWMAQIVEGGSFICGGSLISNRFVLTAAHCRGKTNKGLKVRLGDYNIGTQFDCTNDGCIPRPQDYTVSQTFVHRSFVEYHRYDLALMRLSAAVPYGVHIRPVCLLMGGNANWRWNLVQSIASFNVTGWGRTATTKVSFPLQQSELQHYDVNHCIQRFSRQMDHTHICAGQPNSFTCNGDSGGPLTAKAPSVAGNHIILFGLVSYGFNLCNGPTVFTNVLPYTNWILWHINHYP
ncbi:hypothetical protein KR054_003773 [Drosophila jambulina]|nr:hypothetical protein KR054_003773 [Drosophila jambulina]